MDGISEAIERGEALERDGKPEEAIAYFEALVARHPDNADVVFAYAGALDFAGREVDAVAPYRRAHALGLADAQLPRWYVQFGSTLRNNRAFAEAVAVLNEGRQRCPEDAAIACFLALALHTAGDSGHALRTVIEALLAEAAAGRVDLHHYQRSLRWYALDLTGDAPPD